MSAVTLDRPEQIDRLIAHLIANGVAHQAELYRAVRQGRLGVVQLDRHAAAPMGMLKRAKVPCIVLIGDDDYQSCGSTGWASIPRLLRWASGAMIHGTGGDVSSYQAAITMALACRKFLLIETDSAHLQEWGDALLGASPPVPFVGLRPSNGVHPVVPARASMQ